MASRFADFHFFSEDRRNFIFTTREVARRIGRAENTVTMYAREWGEVQTLCKKTFRQVDVA